MCRRSGLTIAETTATLWLAHLTAQLDVVLEALSLRASYFIKVPYRESALIETIIPLPKKLSIGFVQCPRDAVEPRGHKPLVCYLTLESYQIAHLVTKTVNGIVGTQ
jgi:hypothetical protein